MLWWQRHKETMHSLVLEVFFCALCFKGNFLSNFLSSFCALVGVIAKFGRCHDLCLRQINVFVAVEGFFQNIHLLTWAFWQLTASANATSKNCKRLVINSSPKIVFTDRLQKLPSQIVFLYLSSFVVVCLVICLMAIITRLLRIVAKGHRLWPLDHTCAFHGHGGPIELSVKPTDGKVLRKSRIRTNPIGTHRIKTD